MYTNFDDRSADPREATHNAINLFLLCIVAIGIVLMTFVKPAIAIDPKAGVYISPAAVLVTMEPLPATPMQMLATGPPSRVLLVGKTAMVIHHRPQTQSIGSKLATNSASDKIDIVNKVDRAQADGSPPGAGTHGMRPNFNRFIQR